MLQSTEIPRLQGTIALPKVPRSVDSRTGLHNGVAYCASATDIWIPNGTIRDIITAFGKVNPIDEERYHQVIRACALDPDLDNFPAGDLTGLLSGCTGKNSNVGAEYIFHRNR